MNVAKEGKRSSDGPQVVEIIPIAKGVPKGTLSYFTQVRVSLGSIVRVPLRKGFVTGIVAKVTSARLVKSDLRKANFSLRKLVSIKSTSSLPSHFMKAVERTARYYAVSQGEILQIVLPKFFLDSPELLNSEGTIADEPPREPIYIQIEKEERMSRYKGIVREAFARKGSVLLCVPTHEDTEKMQRELSSGIEEYTYVFSLHTSVKKLKVLVEKAKNEAHPILFITTGAGIAFHRGDLTTLIIERENSRSYQTLSKPQISIKKFAEYLAREGGLELILGDSVLSLQSLLEEKSGESREIFPLKWRLVTTSKAELVDMKKVSDKKGELIIFSEEMKSLIKQGVEKRENVFLFGARKGLSPTTVCGDCGFILPCKNCGAPIVLYERDSGRMYLCHACGAQRTAETRCDNCNSWKLKPMGIGIDLIAAEVRKFYPETPVFIIDKDRVPSRAKAQILIKEIEEARGSIIVGNELALLYLEHFTYAGIVSLDTLFGIPDFGINERIFYLVSTLREMTKKELVIQTRNIGKDILSWAATGNISDFYRSEIAEREVLSYPPFSIFIKVSTLGNADQLKFKQEFLTKNFQSFGPEFIRSKGVRLGQLTLSMILRVSRKDWPKGEIVGTLALLTPDFFIKVDPESLL